METRPNPLILMSLILPMSLIVGAIIRINRLDMADAVITGLIGALVVIGVEQVLRHGFGIGLPGPVRERQELAPLPDFLTLMLLLFSIGAAVGVSAAMVSRFYGVDDGGRLALNVLVVAAACAFMGGMVGLIRHIVRLELARLDREPSQASKLSSDALRP
jgi:hypothetical protein